MSCEYPHTPPSAFLAVSVVCLPVASAAATQAKPKRPLQKVNTTILYPILRAVVFACGVSVQSQSQPVYTSTSAAVCRTTCLQDTARPNGKAIRRAITRTVRNNGTVRVRPTASIPAMPASKADARGLPFSGMQTALSVRAGILSRRRSAVSTRAVIHERRSASYDDPACYCGNGRHVE